MFDSWHGEVGDLDARAVLAVAADLRATAERAEARLLEVAAHFADLHPGEHPDVRGEILPGTERAVVYGGDGCPAVAEFAPLELGAVLRTSSAAAADLIGEALALRHRMPRLWARVLVGAVPAWRARRIASACLRLSRIAAAAVDAQVAPIAEKVTSYRLDRIVQAAAMTADPELAARDADAAATSRGVWVEQSDLHGTKTVVIRAAAGDAIRFDGMVDAVADLLGALGDTGSRDHRRARAVGWLASPQAVLDLWAAARPAAGAEQAGRQVPAVDGIADAAGGLDAVRAAAPDPGRRAVPTLYVHLTDRALAARAGVARVEGTGWSDRLGPMLVRQVSDLIGHDRVVVRPVIDLHDRVSVHAYEVPDRIRQRVQLTEPVCVFPWCSRPSLSTDLDHVVPYDDAGPPGQTSTDNLAPLCRRHHRARTHGQWTYRRLPDGAFEWTSPQGLTYLVDHTGTDLGARRPTAAAA